MELRLFCFLQKQLVMPSMYIETNKVLIEYQAITLALHSMAVTKLLINNAKGACVITLHFEICSLNARDVDEIFAFLRDFKLRLYFKIKIRQTVFFNLWIYFSTKSALTQQMK